jgi:hypothetical protein
VQGREPALKAMAAASSSSARKRVVGVVRRAGGSQYSPTGGDQAAGSGSRLRAGAAQTCREECLREGLGGIMVAVSSRQLVRGRTSGWPSAKSVWAAGSRVR